MRKWQSPGNLILLATCGVLLVAGCVPGVPQLEGAEREAVLAYAEPATDNLLAGLEAGDYAQFSRDMSPEMLAAMTESQFSALRATLEDKVGAYVSRQVTGVEEGDDFIAVNYDARYEDEEHVSMRVVFDQDRQISGLWLDSPKLRQQ
ncbi:MAG: DUF3887 domain-containing protein [Anaerolineaceae bacterium]|nr:DUF3887 domain-containing protein [Anaerolineaceae bacterium]